MHVTGDAPDFPERLPLTIRAITFRAGAQPGA
jgi:hypothetical protein